MDKKLQKKILERLQKKLRPKERYNFTISPPIKQAFSNWCKSYGYKESAVLEALMAEVTPEEAL